MKCFWKKYKEILCKSIAFAVFYVVLVGIGMAAFNRIQASDAGNQNTIRTTIPNHNGNYQKAVASSSGALFVYIDWERQDMMIQSTRGDEYFYISDAKMKTWDEIQAVPNQKGLAYSDLSWVTKAYELNIRGDKDLNDIVKVNIEAPRTLKAKFAMVNEKPSLALTMTETVNKKKVTTTVNPASGASIQWRKGTTGNWQEYNTLNLEDFMTKGATLNLRLKGECNPADVSKCYMPSKVASVKITKKANAPSIKVDASKFNLGVKKGQEYIVSTATTTTSIISITDTAAAKPDLSQLRGNPLEGDGYEKPFKAFSIKARTSSTAKKAASKWAVISYPEQRIITGSALTVKLLEPGKGVTLQNNTTYNIEYMIPTTNIPQTVKTAGINAKTKWTTVKAGKTGKGKGTTITTGTAIFFRYAAEKENAKKGQKAELASIVGITHPTR